MKTLNQTNLGKMLGYSQQMVSSVLLGNARPSYQKAKELEALTNIDREIWLEGTKQERRAAVRLWKYKMEFETGGGDDSVGDINQREQGH